MAKAKTTHTPGPWTEGPEPWQIIGGDPKHQIIVSEVYTKADIALCKAAPDLLEALKGVAGDQISMRGYTEEFRNQIRAAIAKAEGQEVR